MLLNKLTNCIFNLRHLFSNKPLLYNNSEITVIITMWKRNHLEEQLHALLNQSEKPKHIWIIQCGNHINLSKTLNKYPEVKLIHSEIDLKYFARFSVALFVETKYIFVIDDDVIPSSTWLENCRSTCENYNMIVASAGRIIPKNDFQPERMNNVQKYFIGDIDTRVEFNTCLENKIVDFGCNSWFFKTDWIKSFWNISPFTLDTAEDIHLSAVCKIILNISTIVPCQTNGFDTGNLKIKYGRDELASWHKPGFLQKREIVLRYLIEQKGWKPILWG